MKAVDGIDFSVPWKQTLALVGESGCGKSTTAKLVLRLIEPTAGAIFFRGRNLLGLEGRELLGVRREMQIIFQDTFASLNPRKRVREILGQPLRDHGLAAGNLDEKVSEMLERVGLSPPSIYLDRYPHELSGGQRQRVGIGRALTVQPRLIVADEAVSALDVSVKAQILALMKNLQRQLGLSFLFITHDLAVVRSLAHEVAVMYLGLIVERGPVRAVFSNPLHPYTRALLSATPVPNPKLARQKERMLLKGDVPSPVDPPAGCRFHTRCPFVMSRCREEKPELREKGDGVAVACFLHE
ncbi:MAG TPA: oligopeptide/dipeptide ABC transporter ATP-binding protein [candidate division Zixibacteria bacterium]|nr:oligopeptide/dipeptide ABC transporter ATP-binding protein [candidate division Zixibacteria bacterium]